MQAYSNPERESEPTALPDVEVFFYQHGKRELYMLDTGQGAQFFGECIENEEEDYCGTGWYWHSCLPGCLPRGPFKTQTEALADAQSRND